MSCVTSLVAVTAPLHLRIPCTRRKFKSKKGEFKNNAISSNVYVPNTCIFLSLYKNRICVSWNVTNSKITGIFDWVSRRAFIQSIPFKKSKPIILHCIIHSQKPMLFCCFGAVEILRQTSFQKITFLFTHKQLQTSTWSYHYFPQNLSVLGHLSNSVG